MTTSLLTWLRPMCRISVKPQLVVQTLVRSSYNTGPMEVLVWGTDCSDPDLRSTTDKGLCLQTSVYWRLRNFDTSAIQHMAAKSLRCDRVMSAMGWDRPTCTYAKDFWLTITKLVWNSSVAPASQLRIGPIIHVLAITNLCVPWGGGCWWQLSLVL